jgi:pilus assembly protein Flp/PilA
MLVLMRNFLLDENGVTAIEYGLIAALIAIVIFSAVSLAGTNLSLLFGSIATCLGSLPAGC